MVAIVRFDSFVQHLAARVGIDPAGLDRSTPVDQGLAVDGMAAAEIVGLLVELGVGVSYRELDRFRTLNDLYTEYAARAVMGGAR